MTESKEAKKQFLNDLNCSQPVIAQYAPRNQFVVATAFRLLHSKIQKIYDL